MLWAKQRRNRTVEQWKRVVFSDECKFSLKSDGRVYVWSTTGTRYKPENTIEKTTSRFSMMFWGCISGICSRVLLKSPKRCKSADFIDLLETAGIDTLGEDQFVMHDNCPMHRSRKLSSGFTTMVLRKSSVPHTVEIVWAQMKRELNAMHLTGHPRRSSLFCLE